MNIINKKIKIVLILMLLIIEGMSIFLMWKSINNKEIILDDVKLKDIKNKSNVAIMIEQENEDGTTSYVESESSTWPEDMSFNTENSGCMDNSGNKIENAIAYDSTTNMVTIISQVTSYCYIYFDLMESDDLTIAISTDGVTNTIPTGNTYKTTFTCDGITSLYSNKYQRIELSNLSSIGINCNLDYTKDTSTYTLLKTEVESKATSGVDGYRYQGKEPNNWVWFNNEMWRIIGSVPTCTSASISGTSGTCSQSESSRPNLVKIIRAETIGSLTYHSDESNSLWGSGNTLYTLLNEYYYGKGDATGASPCLNDGTDGFALCNYENYGISNSSTDYYGKMIESVYMNVGTSDDYYEVASVYDLEIATVSKLTKIGLMNTSDYGYATSGITYSSTTIDELDSYEQNNWLYGQGYEWTMTSYSESDMFYIDKTGYMEYDYTNLGYKTRPVVYLNSSVYIIDGTGSELDPYIIGM